MVADQLAGGGAAERPVVVSRGDDGELLDDLPRKVSGRNLLSGSVIETQAVEISQKTGRVPAVESAFVGEKHWRNVLKGRAYLPPSMGPADRDSGSAATDVYRNPHLTPSGGPVGRLPALPDGKWGCRRVAWCHCSKQLGNGAGSKALAKSFPGVCPCLTPTQPGLVVKCPREAWPIWATAEMGLQWDYNGTTALGHCSPPPGARAAETTDGAAIRPGAAGRGRPRLRGVAARWGQRLKGSKHLRPGNAEAGAADVRPQGKHPAPGER